MADQDSLEKAQRRRIEFLEKTNERLEEENSVLKSALTHQTIEAENSFRDNIGKFDVIGRQIWSVVANLNKIWSKPATYDQIVKAYQSKYPNVACGETICRRVRKLVEDGWMETPLRGSFIVVAKPNP